MLAKELVRLRKQREKLLATKNQLGCISTRATVRALKATNGGGGRACV